MSYVRQFGEVLPGDAVVLAPSAARTSSGSGPALPTPNGGTLRLDLAVSAVSGTTPSLTVTIEHSPDGSSWSSLGAFPAATTATTARRVLSGLDRFVRASWAITGTTPSVTFSVAGELV